MRNYFKLPEQPSVVQYLLLFPLLGFRDLKEDIKYDTLDGFTIGWTLYLFLVTFWCFAVSVIIYLLYTHPMELLLSVAIILGIVFLLIGIPRILYRRFNRKHKK